jgi:colicin import membrane protein
MSSRLHRKDPGLRWMALLSTALHLALYFCLAASNFSPRLFAENPVCYVDLVSLPVAEPQAGTPAPPGNEPPAPAPQAMSPPAKPPPAVGRKPAAPGETAQQFAERMARLERKVESQHQTAALEAIRQRMANAAKGKQGMPGATGKEAGSAYAAYIQSRLNEAFKLPELLQSKNPEVFVRLTIDRNGRLAGYRIERSTGNKMFENAVVQAIAQAEKSFRPPPNNEPFEYVYNFKPHGIEKH